MKRHRDWITAAKYSEFIHTNQAILPYTHNIISALRRNIAVPLREIVNTKPNSRAAHAHTHKRSQQRRCVYIHIYRGAAEHTPTHRHNSNNLFPFCLRAIAIWINTRATCI